MIKEKYKNIKPYNEKGKPTFKKRNVKGVYIIRNKKDILYVGYSGTDLYKTLIIKYKPKDNPDQYWLNFDTDDKEQEIYKEYLYKNWNVKKVKDNKTNADEYPF